MKHLKKFEGFNIEDNIIKKYYNERDYNAIKSVIDKIDSYTDSYSIRKTDNVIYNLILESRLFKFYKDYYFKMGEKIKSIPIPNTIYEYENVIKNINLYLSVTEESLFKQMLKQLKNMIVYLSYFPDIRKYSNNSVPLDKEIFELFSEFNESELNKISKKLTFRDGAIRISLFFADTNEEVGIIERLYLGRIENIDYYENKITKYYTTLYKKWIEGNNFEEQLYYFTTFFEKHNYTINKIYNDTIHIDDYRNNIILDKYYSLFEKKPKKGVKTFEFTGDFIEDYKKYDDAYQRNK